MSANSPIYRKMMFNFAVVMLLLTEGCSCGETPAASCGSRYMYVGGKVTYNTTVSPNPLQKAFSDKVCKFDMSLSGSSVGFELEVIRDVNSTGFEVAGELREGFASQYITDQLYGVGSNVGITSFTYIFNCKLSDSPEIPHNGFRAVATAVGEELSNPPALVESGTEITMTCDQYYDVKVVGAAEIGVPTIRCENSEWKGGDKKLECVISLGFKIAIIASVISGIIIIFITALFCISCCSRKTPRSKERHEFDEELDLVYRNWEESQERQMMR